MVYATWGLYHGMNVDNTYRGEDKPGEMRHHIVQF